MVKGRKTKVLDNDDICTATCVNIKYNRRRKVFEFAGFTKDSKVFFKGNLVQDIDTEGSSPFIFRDDEKC